MTIRVLEAINHAMGGNVLDLDQRDHAVVVLNGEIHFGKTHAIALKAGYHRMDLLSQVRDSVTVTFGHLIDDTILFDVIDRYEGIEFHTNKQLKKVFRQYNKWHAVLIENSGHQYIYTYGR